MENKQQENQKKGNKKSSKKLVYRIIIGILIFLGISLLAGYVYTRYYLLGDLKQTEKFDLNKEEDRAEIGINDNHNFANTSDIHNILLFGVDSRDEGISGRSDSMMILTLNKKTKKIHLTSFMRDTVVDVDGHGKQKLNHAYAFGGAKLAMKTYNQNFNLAINEYITVDFQGVTHIIDSIGGVEVKIEPNEIGYLNDYLNHINTLPGVNKGESVTSAGLQTLSGAQALAYTRIRYTEGGDYKRTERQRTILEAMMKKAMKMGPIEMQNVLKTVSPYVETNLGFNDLMQLGLDGVGIGNNISQHRLPEDGTFTTGIGLEPNMPALWVIKADTTKMGEDFYNLVTK